MPPSVEDLLSTLLLLTSALQPSADVLPGLALLNHSVKVLPAEGSALLEAPETDLVIVDGRKELAHARDLCRLIRTTGSDAPVLLIVTEGGQHVGRGLGRARQQQQGAHGTSR